MRQTAVLHLDQRQVDFVLRVLGDYIEDSERIRDDSEDDYVIEATTDNISEANYIAELIDYQRKLD